MLPVAQIVIAQLFILKRFVDTYENLEAGTKGLVNRDNNFLEIVSRQFSHRFDVGPNWNQTLRLAADNSD